SAEPASEAEREPQRAAANPFAPRPRDDAARPVAPDLPPRLPDATPPPPPPPWEAPVLAEEPPLPPPVSVPEVDDGQGGAPSWQSVPPAAEVPPLPEPPAAADRPKPRSTPSSVFGVSRRNRDEPPAEPPSPPQPSAPGDA